MSTKEEWIAWAAKMEAERDRLLRCIAGIEDELIRDPPRIGDALWICDAAKATISENQPVT